MSTDRSGRIVALVALAEEAPTAAELAPYLDDPDADVRRTAVSVLTESAPPDAAVALARRLRDDDRRVRQRAVEGLRELREVAIVDDDLRTALIAAARVEDPSTRAAVVRLCREHRLLDLAAARAAALDDDSLVRREAVAAFVALDATDQLVALAADTDPLVRLGVARGLGTLADPSGTDGVLALSHDDDLRVRAAAIESLGQLGLGDRGEARARDALADEAWELRKAAATALGHGTGDAAVEALLPAVSDRHQDVRRAAVQSLARWAPERPDVREALTAAVAGDPDADVRGYARLALAP